MHSIISCVYSASFARNSNSVEVACISDINLRYTFDRSAVKIDRRVLFPCAHVTACDFLGFVASFFLKLSTRIFPAEGTTAIDEENHFV